MSYQEHHCGVHIEVLHTGQRIRRPYVVLLDGVHLCKLNGNGKPSKTPRQFQHQNSALAAGQMAARRRRL